MTEDELNDISKHITELYHLSEEEIRLLRSLYLLPIYKIIQNIIINNKDITVILNNGFSFFFTVPSDIRYDSTIGNLFIVKNVDVVLSICDYVFTKRSLNSLVPNDTTFMFLLEDISEQSLLKLQNCLNEFSKLNATIKKKLYTIQIELNDLIETTIYINLDSQYVEDKINSTENFLHHYKSFYMIENLKGSSIND